MSEIVPSRYGSISSLNLAMLNLAIIRRKTSIDRDVDRLLDVLSPRETQQLLRYYADKLEELT